MIGLDTNILARYYLEEDEADVVTRRQRLAARRLLEGGQPLSVAKTVLLELEWVMRGGYHRPREQFAAVLEHLLALPQVTMEDLLSVEAALAGYRAGLDFADALHLASYRACDSVASFDDRGFVRRVKKLGLAPEVVLPR